MWEDPIYKFQKKIFDVKGNSKNLEITINVTRSAPTMSKPGDQLEGVFRTLTRNKSPEKTKILDVGAAKLRNTLYLLKKGFQVYSVEFEELFKEKKPKGKKKKKKNNQK